jgi:isopentenyl diphosphate isomerase/L-lactate dehydrogenase-like FMN-dependent dehydrogenase
LLDPIQFEQAGRAFRQWLDRLRGIARPQPEPDIAWEDGEVLSERRSGLPPDR